MICLRDYQQELINDIYRAMGAGDKRVIASLATGGGKSIVGAKVCQDCADKGLPVLWVVHRRELVAQAADHLINAGLDPAFIMAGEKPDPSKPVQIASIQTLVKRKPPPATLVVYDEAHHSASATSIKALSRYEDAFWLGLTATPARLDGKGLKIAGWQRIVDGPATRWLIEQGFLAEYDYWAPTQPDMKGVPIRGGDFAKGEAAERMGVVVGEAVKWYEKFLDGKQAIVFCASVEQSLEIEHSFQGVCIPCRHADAKTKKRERERTMDAFRAGDLRVLTNVQLVDEGFDVPECDGAIIARPTRSLVFHRQSCGRALRPKANGGKAIIVDMAGNVGRLGFPCEPVKWTLEGRPPSDGVPPIRTCGECYAVVPASAKACPKCGTVFPIEQRTRTPTQIDGVLHLLTKGTTEHETRQKEIYQALVLRASERGWKLMASRVQFKGKTGIWLSPWVRWAQEMDMRAKRDCQHARVEEGRCRFCGKPRPIQGTLWSDRLAAL